MARIAKVEVLMVDLKPKVKRVDAIQSFVSQETPIVRITDADGAVGTGYSYTIGTGGSGGREGPIAQIGAGFGSLLGRLLRLRPADRRVLVAAGMGAGIAAIFRAPLAGALFAAEVLYRSPEFEPDVLMPAGLASTVAYSVFGLFFGWRPLFTTPNLKFGGPIELAGYGVLVLALRKPLNPLPGSKHYSAKDEFPHHRVAPSQRR